MNMWLGALADARKEKLSDIIQKCRVHMSHRQESWSSGNSVAERAAYKTRSANVQEKSYVNVKQYT